MAFSVIMSSIHDNTFNLDLILDEFESFARKQIGDEAFLPGWHQLKKAISTKTIEGFVAIHNNLPIGVIFFKRTPETAQISFGHVLSRYAHQDIQKKLMAETIRYLKQKTEIKQIQGQLTFLGAKIKKINLNRLFQKEKFNFWIRTRMTLKLRREYDIEFPKWFFIKTWNIALVNKFASIFSETFADDPDILSLPDFQNQKVIRATLKKMTKPSQYGQIISEATLLLMHRNKSKPCGVTLCITTTPTTGFIGAIGISKAYRNKGLGKTLMQMILNEFKHQGLKRGELAVTLQNESAYRLYTHLGFKPTLYAYNFNWERNH